MDLHRNLKIKFSDNKIVGYDLFQSFLEALDDKLGNRELKLKFFKGYSQGKAPSHKTPALTQSMNMEIWVVGTLN